MKASNALRLRAALSALMVLGLVLTAGASWAVTTPTVNLVLVGTPDFAPTTTFDVRVTLTNPDDGFSTAPVGANLRVFFDNSVAMPTAILGTLDMYNAIMGPVEGTAPNNWFDIAITGPANTDTSPLFCTLTFTSLQSATSSISIGDDPAWPINVVTYVWTQVAGPPYNILVATELPHLFGPALDIGPPLAVHDWLLFR